MILKWIPFFILVALAESAYQIFFKKGATEFNEISGIRFYLKLLKNRWIIAGLLVSLIEMILWVTLLSKIPLSLAFPVTGMQKIFLIFFTAFVLKEKVYKAEWIGIVLIALGIITIAYSG